MHDAVCFFFFNDTATTEIYTLSLHDALPISWSSSKSSSLSSETRLTVAASRGPPVGVQSSAHIRSRATAIRPSRSEEHTSELQSRQYLVCRLLLEKKKKNNRRRINRTIK